MIEFRFARHKQFTIMAGTLLVALVFGLLAWSSAGKLRVYAGVFTVLFGVIAPAMHLPRLFQRGVVLYGGSELVAFSERLFAVPLSWWWANEPSTRTPSPHPA